MILHCGNCKAKYQLSDERVAGKTVRMKCRKCEHLIEAKGPPLEEATYTGPVSAAASSADSAPASEQPSGWYAGIEGKPTGPMSVEDLAEKLKGGAITGDSLVWREGLDGWKPLSSFPELAGLLVVEEPPKPAPLPAVPPSVPRLAPVVPASRPSVAGIPRPPVARASVPRTSFAPTSSRLAAAPRLEEEPAPSLAAVAEPEPAPAPEPAITPEPVSAQAPLSGLSVAKLAQPEPEPAPLAQPEPVPVPSPAIAPLSAPAPERAESVIVPVTAKRRGVHPAIWAVMGLGGVAVAFFAGRTSGEKQPETPVAAVSEPAPPPPAPSAPAEPVAEPEVAPAAEAPAEAAEAPDETPEAPARPEPAKVAAAPSAPAKPKSTAAAPSNTTGGAAPAMTGLSSLSGLAAGPTPGPSKTTSAGGGGALSQAEVERVVQQQRAFVKRRCWELALSTKAKDAPSSARVVTSITIAPDGRVTNVSATGGDGYPGLASCVAGQARAWKFPASEGGTVNVPFVFAAQ